MTKRYVVSVSWNGQERVRRAVHAENLQEAVKMDVFEDLEMDQIEEATSSGTPVTIKVEQA